eukprot:TRINITY_DN21199_c0_g1_i1.p1 TRINITY_DN21199_c0_g1~~TRINITY_DN21199_c0_g1_i1.p1  ORF type:complete len:223 (-),score=40.84 TRINITY_DN21199_c0_g1_i1:63-731(-)
MADGDAAKASKVVDQVRVNLDFADTIKKEMAAYRPTYKKYTEAERVQMLSCLSASIRPRPVLGLIGGSAPKLRPLPGVAGTLRGVDYELCDLRERPDLNGRRCHIVEDKPDPEGRVLVKLRAGSDGSAGGKEMRVKAARLKCADGSSLALTGGKLGRRSASDAALQPLSASLSCLDPADFNGGPMERLGLTRSTRGFRRNAGGRFYSDGMGHETDARLTFFY